MWLFALAHTSKLYRPKRAEVLMEEIIAHKVEGVETLDPEGVEAMLETVADAADAFEISGG